MNCLNIIARYRNPSILMIPRRHILQEIVGIIRTTQKLGLRSEAITLEPRAKEPAHFSMLIESTVTDDMIAFQLGKRAGELLETRRSSPPMALCPRGGVTNNLSTSHWKGVKILKARRTSRSDIGDGTVRGCGAASRRIERNDRPRPAGGIEDYDSFEPGLEAFDAPRNVEAPLPKQNSWLGPNLWS
ncbi:hypothetical protein EVAR_18038_1 [Eumeta japonica]|uniref:Uncharacterized protein n=1 Tax=Eumeta variegata TaxID=151549 RepID=A0A4C1XXA7_EUMVA|nr:hypothetical protein EVAR_18038_1 [Eumeta japonica]